MLTSLLSCYCGFMLPVTIYYLRPKISSFFTHLLHINTKAKRLQCPCFIKSQYNYSSIYLLPIQLFLTFTNSDAIVNLFWDKWEKLKMGQRGSIKILPFSCFLLVYSLAAFFLSSTAVHYIYGFPGCCKAHFIFILQRQRAG